MNKRTIMIFPEFDNMHIIEGLRQKYDPLYSLVQPHITLVFPFESELTVNNIKSVLEKNLASITPFYIEVQGVQCSDRWMYLKVTQGEEFIVQIHERLYQQYFSRFKPNWLKLYKPHLTVGQFNSAYEAKQAYEIEKCQTDKFSCIVNTITVETIGNNEESIIEIEHRL